MSCKESEFYRLLSTRIKKESEPRIKEAEKALGRETNNMERIQIRTEYLIEKIKRGEQNGKAHA